MANATPRQATGRDPTDSAAADKTLAAKPGDVSSATGARWDRRPSVAGEGKE